MRTGRTLTVFRGRTPPSENLEDPPSKKKTPPGRHPWQTPPLADTLPLADTPLADTPPPVDRMTHACENITLAKTSFRPVNIYAQTPPHTPPHTHTHAYTHTHTHTNTHTNHKHEGWRAYPLSVYFVDEVKMYSHLPPSVLTVP